MKLFIATIAAFFACATAAQSAALSGAFSIAVPVLSAPAHMDGDIDASWSKAVRVSALFDFTYQRNGEPTAVYVAQDPGGLDVAFQARQQAAFTDSSETNGAGVMNDDNVTVALWPQGDGGFSYTFSANARGVRYQTSSENSAYAPEWTAVGKRTPGGYVVTMRIPFQSMRSGNSTAWKVQFERVVQATNSTQVWEHVEGQRNAADRAFAGTLQGIVPHGGTAQARPKPRLQLYGLGEVTNRQNGGSTSRIGADIALPVTATSSLLASFHPDYSNVEVDQQTIAPSAFARRFNEVRPFFTQLSSNFNNTFSCTNCPTTLYTPAIPTFKQGYAYEGTQGKLNFAAFDAVGAQRSDSAETLSYTDQDPAKILGLSLQRVLVDVPGFHDDTTTIYTGYEWQKTHRFVYFNGGTDRGTAVTQPGFADYFEYGGGYVDKNTVYGVSIQKLGPQFSPADGFVQQLDVAGLTLFYNTTFHFGADAALQDISLSNGYSRMHDHSGNPAQNGYNGQVNFDFRHQLTLHVFGGYSANETFDGEYLPFNQNGAFVGYKSQTSTPDSIMFAEGRYSHGTLRSWSYVATLPLRRSLNLTLETDENAYSPRGLFALREPAATQWLERAGLDWQFNRNASFDVGLRRIAGRNLPNAFQAPDLPTPAAPCGTQNGFEPFDCVNAGNVSAAFHFLAAQNEWYVVYGNPNNLATLPAFYVKWIRYIGAQKGT